MRVWRGAKIKCRTRDNLQWQDTFDLSLFVNLIPLGKVMYISDSKAAHVTRLMFHNVNGLSLRGIEGIDMFVHEQSSLEVDIQGITEHGLDTTKFPVYQTASDIVKQTYDGQSLLYLNSSTETALNIYKPGGTGFLVIYDATKSHRLLSSLHTKSAQGPPISSATPRIINKSEPLAQLALAI